MTRTRVLELAVFRHLWGLDEPLSIVAPRIAAAGYAGIETELPPRDECAALRAELDASGLRYIPVILLDDASKEDQVCCFREALELARTFDPVRVTAHTGCDAWPLSRSIELYKRIVEVEAEVGLRAAHETHRGRSLFTPWDTAAILEVVPELLLCCDFSHWVLVGERFLEDQRAAIELAARHALHVHARVGCEESPQVSDPRAPEYANHLEVFESWWRLVWDAQRAAGAQTCTLTPEYGPPPYLQKLPYTGVPVANLAEVCDWQAARAREQFDAWQQSLHASSFPFVAESEWHRRGDPWLM